MACLEQEIRPVFVHPIFVDGSFVTDKDEPEDVDIVLDLKEASDEQKFRGLMFMKEKQSPFYRTYNVHFLVNVDTPGFPDLSAFFQYIGIKSLDPRHLKGILRVVQ